MWRFGERDLVVGAKDERGTVEEWVWAKDNHYVHEKTMRTWVLYAKLKFSENIGSNESTHTHAEKTQIPSFHS